MSSGPWRSPSQVFGRPVLTVTQVQELYCVTRRTVYNWMSTGKIEWALSPGGRRYIFADSVQLRNDAAETA
jgi:predicted site-specific integrase-resolvase